MTTDPQTVVSLARECVGTPFVHQGRILGVGLDCAGVICHVAAGLGLSHDAPSAYGRLPFSGMLQQVLDRQDCLVKVDGAMQAGDVMLMRFVGDPQHLGICAGDTMIHAYQSAGKCVEHGIDAAWRRRIVAVYRFEEPA